MNSENEDFRIGQPLAIGFLIGIAIAKLYSFNRDPLKDEFDCIINLKKQLSKAILEENYEKAAELRDLIKEMEGKDV